MEQQSSLEQWVADLQEAGSEDVRSLGQAFEYLLDNVEAYESGELAYEDIPPLQDPLAWMSLEAVRFGTLFCKTTVDNLYAVENIDSGFDGVYGQEEAAADRAAMVDNLVCNEHALQGAEDEVISYFDSAPDTVSGQMLVRCFRAWRDCFGQENSVEAFLDANPFGNERFTLLVAYSVLFGMAWERVYPSLYGAFDDSGLQGIFATEEQANDATHQDGYVQRIALADGSVTVDELLAL